MRIKLKIFLICFLSCLVLILPHIVVRDKSGKYIFIVAHKNEVIIHMNGGLGNNMFQYATAYSYAKKHNKKLIIGGRYKKFTETFHTNEEKVNSFINQNVYNDSWTHNFETEINNPYWNVLIGYFQNELYFKKYRKDLLRIFEFKEPLVGENKKIADEIKSKNAISIHVRRGDYLKVWKNDLLSNHYYLLAMDYMASKVKEPYFYIFSDDTEWVKNNLKVKYNHRVIENNRGGGSCKRYASDEFMQASYCSEFNVFMVECMA